MMDMFYKVKSLGLNACQIIIGIPDNIVKIKLVLHKCRCEALHFLFIDSAVKEGMHVQLMNV